MAQDGNGEDEKRDRTRAKGCLSKLAFERGVAVGSSLVYLPRGTNCLSAIAVGDLDLHSCTLITLFLRVYNRYAETK